MAENETEQARREAAVEAARRAAELEAAGQFEGALAAYDRVATLVPDVAAAHYHRGRLLTVLGRLAEAAEAHGRVAALRPDDAEAAFAYAVALHATQSFAEAVAAYDRATALAPTHVGAWSNRGLALLALNRPEEALAALDRAVGLEPGSAAVHNNRGLALRELNRPRKAMASFDRALALAPDFPEAACNRAVSQLLLGELEAGFKGHEQRWRMPPVSFEARPFAEPAWLGEGEIAGKTLLLHAEQGFGDTIQFCRYAALAKARGARVVLEAPRPLLPVLTSLQGVDVLAAKGEPLPPFDLHTPLMSAPLAFATTLETVPASPAYLAAPADRVAHWRGRLGAPRDLRIGVAWFGKPTHSNDHNRSIPLEVFAQALPEGIEIVSLHDRMREEDRAALAGLPQIRRFDGEIADFGDTAALASLVDLVVTVDTSVAHLAAALGRPTWILSPFAPDWRWLLDRQDSPWYPTARLFRQPALRDWASVIGRLRGELEGLAAARQG